MNSLLCTQVTMVSISPHVMKLLNKTQTLSLYYAQELHSICAIWTGKINGTEFRTGADLIENALRTYRNGKLITCSSPMHVVDKDATLYLCQEWLPRVAGGVLHYWADVVPSLSRRSHSDETVEEQNAIPGITLAQFASIDKAKVWLQAK